MAGFCYEENTYIQVHSCALVIQQLNFTVQGVWFSHNTVIQQWLNAVCYGGNQPEKESNIKPL